MKKTLLQIILGTAFLMLACAAPGHAQGSCTATPTVTLDSDSTAGIFTYYLNETGEACIGSNINVSFTGMGGVTNAFAQTGSLLQVDGNPTVTFNSTSANFDFGEVFLVTGNTGVLEIDCSSCMIGTVNWSISAEDPTIPGPVSAIVTGAPEPPSVLLLASGLFALLGLAYWKKRSAHEALLLS